MILGVATLWLLVFLLAIPRAWREAYGSPDVKVYFDSNDWWIGLYRGPNHIYVCPVPTLVIRWRRHGRKS